MPHRRGVPCSLWHLSLAPRITQACGLWEKALEVAEKNDRIHLRTTHYAYAQVHVCWICQATRVW
jgi:hypothetical protein